MDNLQTNPITPIVPSTDSPLVESKEITNSPQPQASESNALAQLTPRQREVLALLTEGKTNKAIATELGMAVGTVKIHCLAIFRQLKVENRTQAAMVASKHAFARTN